MIVCIAEKPSVAMEIAKILGADSRKDGYMEGNGYQVTWTFGHLCELKSPDEYNPAWNKWSLQSLPMIPDHFGIRLIKDRGIAKQFKIIKKLYSKADEIINCGDAGQEGELIQRWVMQLADVKCPVKRLWISSLTEEAIRDGFSHLQPQSHFDNLYMAGLARACGDWLLGMNCTRLYTLKYGDYRQILSIGRVQTPTLAMIVQRDKDIASFKSEPYWILMAKYRGVNFTSREKINSKDKAASILSLVKGKPFTITDIQKRECREQPPQLYDLTSLQVDLNNKYGYSASESLKLIQSLYEKKVSTYPRVDTRYLSDDIYPKCKGILSSLRGYKEITASLVQHPLLKSRRVFDASKVTDHHAIIPTGKSAVLSDKERKVYDLICRRFIAVFMPDYRYMQTTVKGRVGDTGLQTSGRRTAEPGWNAAYKGLASTPSSASSSDQGADTASLPAFTIGESGFHTPSLKEKKTMPPKHYTEATLLRDMETAGKFVEDEELRSAMKENGIGRPSSRASIIETLIRRGYIRRDRKNLVSTPTGTLLIATIKSPLLKSPQLTGEWEKKLREIGKGTYDSREFLAELKQQLSAIIYPN